MIHEPIKLHTQKEVDLARKQGYEICEALYSQLIKRLKEEHKKQLNEKISSLSKQ